MPSEGCPSAKVLHFCAYTWLALLALLPIKRRSLAVLAALAMILLGVALEFSQKLVPGREFEIRDMFINGTDVLTGFAFGILSRIVPVVSSSGSSTPHYLALAAQPPCRCSWLA